MNVENGRFQSFGEFYPYYLGEHRNSTCRKLHFIGTLLMLNVLVTVLFTGFYQGFFLLPIVGYGFAWVGHFFFEKNRPATFKYPLYSLVGDFVMFYQLLTGKIPFDQKPGASTPG